MAKFDDNKITQCLHALEQIETHGANNMLQILFVRQTLMNPIREEVPNGSDQAKRNRSPEKAS